MPHQVKRKEGRDEGQKKVTDAQMGGIGQFKLLAILNNGQSENALGTIGGNFQYYFFILRCMHMTFCMEM